ncbi:MAG: D-(-)-3-hydroxybutyrate oligomer hydrolase [Geminicoccaceae bacterium]|nr:D-(-)-3-hydroxybutyrate oligomer hydrolase [Geminicoccaceae bacterium]
MRARTIHLMALGLAALGHAAEAAEGSCTRYDGVSDDLLTAGLGAAGLAGPAPAFADPLNPTAAELRRLAIYSNYRALVDMTPGGGYGRLYGPNVTNDGVAGTGEGKVAGVECLAYTDAAKGTPNVTLMVQVPDTFDPKNACIVTAASSGSRGVYGAVATAGEWGLKEGCAVAYTDKGTGMGAHDLSPDTVNLIDGRRAGADAAGDRSNFTAGFAYGSRKVFTRNTPGRFAFKHAHGQGNSEADWGLFVLESIHFAFAVLEHEGHALTPENTTVIASSVSNGAGAAIRAAEMDKEGLIDGVAVSEPNVNPRPSKVAIQQGNGPTLNETGRPLYDYVTLINLYQPCANLAPENAAAPLNLVPADLGANRCRALASLGLLPKGATEKQARRAQAIINGYGILPEQNVLGPSHWFLYVPQSIAVTYANAYARYSVRGNLCGYSMGATGTDGRPVPLDPTAVQRLFGVGNGIPPTGGVNLINNRSVGGALEDRVSVSPSTGLQDQDLDNALCLRWLWRDVALGRGTRRFVNEPLRRRTHRGVRAVLASGDLGRRPTVVVTGRNDAIIPPNHGSRAYLGLNRVVEGINSRLHYYEVTNAQHLDALNGLPGFDTRFVPLHHYFIEGLNLLYDHLKNGSPLPPSQVVHTTPRAGTPGAAEPVTVEANLPPIAATPAAGAGITFTNIIRVTSGAPQVTKVVVRIPD